MSSPLNPITAPCLRSTSTFWLLACCTLALTSSVTYLYGAEFVTVALLQQTASYPFGGEGPAPWHYQTAARYAGVMFSFGFLFFLLLGTAIRACVKKQAFLLSLTLGFTMALLTVACIVQMIGLEQ